MNQPSTGDARTHLQDLAEFYRRTSHRVVHTCPECFWIARRPPLVFSRVPHHYLAQASGGDLTRLFLRGPAIAVHYAHEPPEPGAANGALLALRDKQYEVESLSPNTRSKVRRGLKRCRVREMSGGELATQGYALLADLYERTNRQPGTRTRYETVFCPALAAARWTEIWGAFVDEALAAYLVAHRVGEAWVLSSRASHQRYHGMYANNALVFTVLHEKIRQAGIAAVYDTFMPMEAAPSIGEFKLSMGYELVPIVRRFVVHPLLRPTVNRATQRFCSWLARKQPRNVVARKAAAALNAVLKG